MSLRRNIFRFGTMLLEIKLVYLIEHADHVSKLVAFGWKLRENLFFVNSFSYGVYGTSSLRSRAIFFILLSNQVSVFCVRLHKFNRIILSRFSQINFICKLAFIFHNFLCETLIFFQTNAVDFHFIFSHIIFTFL